MDVIYENNVLLLPFPTVKKEPFCLGCYNIKKHSHHLHNYIEIIYLLEGSVKFHHSFNTSILEKGDMVIINPTEVHSICSNPEDVSDNLVMLIGIDADYYDLKEYLFIQKSRYYKEFAPNTAAAAKAYLTDIYRLYCTETNENRNELHEKMTQFIKFIKINFQMHYYIAQTNSISAYVDQDLHSDRLRSIIYFFKMHFEEKVTLDDLASSVHINKYYLSRLIHKGFGLSFNELISLVRSDRAMVLLLGTEYPIGYIFNKTGFSSYNSFTASYKKHAGINASEYRKTYRNHILKKEPFESTRINDHNKILNFMTSLNKRYQYVNNRHDIKEIDGGLFYKAFPFINKENETVIFVHNGQPVDAGISIISLRNWQDSETPDKRLFISKYDLSRRRQMGIENIYIFEELMDKLNAILTTGFSPDLFLQSDQDANTLSLKTILKPGKSILFLLNGTYSLNVSNVLS